MQYQDSKGTVDEKIPYALQDLEALRVPGCLTYGGDGWSSGVLHTLAASRLAAYCMPDAVSHARTQDTIELDHTLAAIFGLWELIIPASRRFLPPAGVVGGLVIQEPHAGSRPFPDSLFFPTGLDAPVDINQDALMAEAHALRTMFFLLFAEAIVRTIKGEDEIWLLERGVTERLYRWSRLAK